jgi:hypothetical protein
MILITNKQSIGLALETIQIDSAVDELFLISTSVQSRRLIYHKLSSH